ncbi:MAG: relaxase/mobilization nuclease domain-containing protein [Bacteroidota bacterium]
MIGKVSIGKSFGGCVRYVMEKDQAQVLDQSGIRSQNAVVATQDFNAIRRENPDVKNAVWHTSISFAHQDKLTDQQMVDIGRDYLNKMDLKNHQYLMVRHRDTQHEHMHIVVNRIGLNGDLASDRWCKNRTAKACDQLEVKYGLTIAKEQGLKKQFTRDKVPIKKQLKSEIRSEIDKHLQRGINSMDRLKKELGNQGISLEIKKQSTGRVNGVSFAKDGMAFKGSAISKEFSYGRLVKQLENNRGQERGMSL